MTKINIAHYKYTGKDFWVNGGKLYIDTDIVYMKYFFKKVAVFDRNTLSVFPLIDEMIYKSVRLSDGKVSVDCRFFKKDYAKFIQRMELIK